MEPNFFEIAKSQFLQNHFFVWLLNWANDENKDFNKELNKIAKDFVRLLLGEKPDFPIKNVKAVGQWNNIDIKVAVNDEYIIAINNKLSDTCFTTQLMDYKIQINEHYPTKKNKFIYLITKNDDWYYYSGIRDLSFDIIDRQMILDFMNKQQTDNDIFNDYKDYLNKIEIETNSFNKYHNIITNSYAAEGFYLKLKNIIMEKNLLAMWEYDSDMNGDFIKFYYYDLYKIENIGMLFIQLENHINGSDIQLNIKICQWEPSTDNLQKIFNELKPIAEKNGLYVVKPNKYIVDHESTVAIVPNLIKTDNDDNINWDDFLQTLEKLEKTIDEYNEEKISLLEPD